MALFDVAALAVSVHNLGDWEVSNGGLDLPRSWHLGFSFNLLDTYSNGRLLATIETVWAQRPERRTVLGLEAGAVFYGIGVVGRWPLGSGRFAPFVRASGGLASLALSWPEGGARETDPAWSAGGGLEFSLARPVVLRLQGRWMGQREDDGTTRSHGTAELAAYYAFHTANFVVPPVTTSP